MGYQKVLVGPSVFAEGAARARNNSVAARWSCPETRTMSRIEGDRPVDGPLSEQISSIGDTLENGRKPGGCPTGAGVVVLWKPGDDTSVETCSTQQGVPVPIPELWRGYPSAGSGRKLIRCPHGEMSQRHRPRISRCRRRDDITDEAERGHRIGVDAEIQRQSSDRRRTVRVVAVDTTGGDVLPTVIAGNAENLMIAPQQNPHQLGRLRREVRQHDLRASVRKPGRALDPSDHALRAVGGGSHADSIPSP